MKLSVPIFLQSMIYALSVWFYGDTLAQTISNHKEMQVIKFSAPELEKRAVKRILPQPPPEVTAVYLQGATGELMVEVRIDEKGKVIQAKAIAGVSLLRPYAVEAAKQWEFEPAKAGTATTFVGTIIFPVPREIYGLDLNVERDLKFYQDAANESPNSWVAHCVLAKAFAQKKRYQQAIESYQKALSLHPKAAIAYYGLGRSYCDSRKQCEREQSRKAYQRAIEINPGFIEAYLGLAWSYDTPETQGEAIAAWNQILRDFPDLETRRVANQNLSGLHTRNGNKDEQINALKELVRVKEELMEIKPDGQARFNVGAEYISLASKYRELGKYEDAITSYEKALADAPATYVEWEASFSMVDVYKKKGDQVGAMRVLQEMLTKVNKRFQPNASKEEMGSAYHAQGRIYEEMGRLNDALAAYQASLKQRPDWIKPHVELYYLHRKMGNQAAAEKEFSIIKKHDDEFARSLIKGEVIKIK
jgi:tetratricopeptide (TPR) repeat protein